MIDIDTKRARSRATQVRRRTKWRALGLCISCGGVPSDGRVTCDTCLQRHRKNAARRLKDRAAKKQCYRCGDSYITPDYSVAENNGSTQCPCCFFRNISMLHLGTRESGTALQTIFDSQHGRCALSGELLILGGNASLDHIMPKSRGGTNDLDNLQWLTKTVNNSKRALTNEEFIVLCRKVAKCELPR